MSVPSGPAPEQRRLQVPWTAVGATWLVVGTVSAVALRWWQSAGRDLPSPPLMLAVLMLGVAVATAALGLRVRRWVRRGDPVDGLGATRTLVLGQSAAVAGAAVAGYLTALAGLALPRFDAPEPREVALHAAVGLVAALAASAAGMLAQWCCRVPPSDDPSDDRPLPG